MTQLSLLTSQTGNFTFTNDELTQALQETWNDPFVVNNVVDSTLTFSSGVFSYLLPSTVSMVRSIWYQPTSTNPLQEIAPDLYRIDGKTLTFVNDVQSWLDDTYQLTIKGRYKLTTSDSLLDNHQINYVLNLAAENLLNRLLLKKTFVFLTNDTSVGEILNAIKIYQTRVLTAKQSIARQFETV